MKKKLLTFSFLITAWMLNSGFIFKPDIRVFSCVWEGEFVKELVTASDRKLLTEMTTYIFDIKTAQIYEYNNQDNTVKPVSKEIIDDYEYAYSKNKVVNSKIFFVTRGRDVGSTNTETWETLVDLKNNKLTDTFADGSKQESLVCRNVKLPKDIKIINSGIKLFNQKDKIVNSRDDIDTTVVGKFNCTTGEFKLTKDDDLILSESLKKNKWYSKEEFIIAIKDNYESYGSVVFNNPVKQAEEKYRIRMLRSKCD
tara:strand:+ start:24 stop:785 length:762 start_codon:yes stop_codon:yes gene_type:complete